MNNQNLKPFRNGYDPRRNVTGANKGSLHIKARLERYATALLPTPEAVREAEPNEKAELLDIALLQQFKRACDGDLKALEFIVANLFGKPTQRIETEDVTPAKDITDELTPQQTDRILGVIRSAFERNELTEEETNIALRVFTSPEESETELARIELQKAVALGYIVCI